MTFHKNPSSGIQVVQRGQALQGSLLAPIHFATHLKRKLNDYFISFASLNNGHLYSHTTVKNRSRCCQSKTMICGNYGILHEDCHTSI